MRAGGGRLALELTSMSAIEMSRRMAAGELTAEALMQATLERIAAVNGDVNAIVSLRDPETLLAEAAQADGQDRKGWLHGIPMAIKDLADAKGLPTSSGSPLSDKANATADDLMVARLRAAGALIIGKTNTPEFGYGSHSFNPVHGVTRNPYDLTRSAGGSSGGAAVALATGMVAVADGSDMMGSLRNPAGWNNVYGMRPTWGLVPPESDGDLYLHSLSTNGPMARAPMDLAAMLDTMAGPDPRRPIAIDHVACLPQIDQPVGDIRIGWLEDWSGALPMEPGVLEICDAALADMSGMGWAVTPVPAPFDADVMWQSWIDLRSFAIAPDRAADFDDPVRRRLLKPAACWEVEHGRSLDAMAVQRASEDRSDWFRTALDLFERFDILALPSAQLWPFDADLVHPVEIAGVAMDTYHRWMQVVIPASLIGLPAISVPVGFGVAGLPMGLQLIGRPGSDSLLLRVAQRWHQRTEWPQRRPPAL
jgi:amidase